MKASVMARLSLTSNATMFSAFFWSAARAALRTRSMDSVVAVTEVCCPFAKVCV